MTIKISQNGGHSLGCTYFVVVLDVGFVYQGKSLPAAVKGDYALRSRNGDSRFAKKTVTLLQDTSIVMQYAWKSEGL